MKRSSNIFWCLRVHPRKNNKNYIKNLSENLKINNCHNFEIKVTSNIVLFSLLKSTVFQLHITQFSSVAIEALGFKINTIILSKEGYNSFKEMIENGIFNFVITKKILWIYFISIVSIIIIMRFLKIIFQITYVK